MDSEDPAANPNLGFVYADTAAVIHALRAEGRRVLLHCVAAEQRTPTVAVAYAALLRADRHEAAQALREVLPTTRGRGYLWDFVCR